ENRFPSDSPTQLAQQQTPLIGAFVVCEISGEGGAQPPAKGFSVPASRPSRRRHTRSRTISALPWSQGTPLLDALSTLTISMASAMHHSLAYGISSFGS